MSDLKGRNALITGASRGIGRAAALALAKKGARVIAILAKVPPKPPRSAQPLGSQGIRVDAVAPGVIDTDMSNFVRSDESRSAVFGFQALKRVGHPDDVADVIAFLASDESRRITGESIEVGGGSKLGPARCVIRPTPRLSRRSQRARGSRAQGRLPPR